MASASVVSTADSGRPIYAWFNAPDRTVYWWTDADVAYVNTNANQMFEDFNRGVADMDFVEWILDIQIQCIIFSVMVLRV